MQVLGTLERQLFLSTLWFWPNEEPHFFLPLLLRTILGKVRRRKRITQTVRVSDRCAPSAQDRALRRPLTPAVLPGGARVTQVPVFRLWADSEPLCCACSLHCARLIVTPWTVARQAPLSLGILQAGVGCHALLQGIFPTQGSDPGLQHCRWIHYHLRHWGRQTCSNTFLFFPLFFISWRLISLQYCSGFMLYIDMNQPWIYMCSPSWTPLPPPANTFQWQILNHVPCLFSVKIPGECFYFFLELMFAIFETGRGRRGWQRMRWLDEKAKFFQ